VASKSSTFDIIRRRLN